MSTVNYILVDATTGFSTGVFSVPARLFDPTVPEGQRMVVPADGLVPAGPLRVDLRKVRKELVAVASVASVQSSWRPTIPAAARFAMLKQIAVDGHDREYAGRIAALRGPLAALHTEKRRQAEAGSGALIADEADRNAILANAAREDEAIAAIEAERRRIKAALKAARTEDDIKAALAAVNELQGGLT